MRPWVKRTLRQAAISLLRSAPSRANRALASMVVETMTHSDRRRYGLQPVASAVELLARNRLAPATVLDVGAHLGDWAACAAKAFPRARLVLIEALPELQPQLEALATTLDGRAAVRQVLLGREARDSVEFHSMGSGSSLFEEVTAFPRECLRLPMATLDAVASGTCPPYLLKLDVQGAELEVLRGAPRVLGSCAAVILEAALLEYNKGAPLIAEVIAFMLERDFVLYDFCGGFRRATDDALFQVDCVFVPASSPLRLRHKFWDTEP